MNIIWHILLTVCVSGQCLSQDVQWFDGASAKKDCFLTLKRFQEIPADGDWDKVIWECKPKGAKAV